LPLLADALRAAQHDAVHVRDYDMAKATDPEIFARAAAEDRIVVSAVTDFGTLLAQRHESKPSVSSSGAVPLLVEANRRHGLRRSVHTLVGHCQDPMRELRVQVSEIRERPPFEVRSASRIPLRARSFP
jgi:hypothetical protein